MTRKYTFTAKDLEIIREARKKNKDKRAEVRLHALELRAEGKRSKAIEEAVGVSAPYVSQLCSKVFFRRHRSDCRKSLWRQSEKYEQRGRRAHTKAVL